MKDEAYRAECRRRAREQFDREYGEASSSFPGEAPPGDTYGIEARARRQWETDPAFRAEFVEFERFVAFCRADAKGLIRIFAPGRRA